MFELWSRINRILIHIPIGFICAFIGESHPIVAVIFAYAFIYGYEFDEDKYIKDQAWKDIAGFIWGMGIYYVGEFILKSVFTSY